MARATNRVLPTARLPAPEFGGEDHVFAENHRMSVLPAALGGHNCCESHLTPAAQSLDGCGQSTTDTHPCHAATFDSGGHIAPVTHQDRAAREEGGGQRTCDAHEAAAPSLLNIYVSTYESAQKLRKATMNRIRCWLRDTHPAEEWADLDFSDETVLQAEWLPNDLRDTVAHISDLEKAAARCLRREIPKHPLWPWLANVRGIGEVLAGRLLHRLDDLTRFPSPAHLWSYCGLDGPGWKERPHSWPLTSLCFNIGESFQKQPALSGGYRDVYDARKAYEQTKPWCGSCHPKGNTEPREDCTPGHINNKARRYAVKCLLKDLWAEGQRQTEEVTAK